MELHLRYLEGEEQKVIADLIHLCGDKIKLEPYSYFVVVKIETTYESGLNALFAEKHLFDGDYRIVVFKREDHKQEVDIPLKFIDCLFGL